MSSWVKVGRLAVMMSHLPAELPVGSMSDWRTVAGRPRRLALSLDTLTAALSMSHNVSCIVGLSFFTPKPIIPVPHPTSHNVAFGFLPSLISLSARRIVDMEEYSGE